MVKANAYGVGDSLVVSELLSMGVKNFGVARVFEGQRIRRLHPYKKFNILVFAPLCASDIEDYLASDLTPVIGSVVDIDILNNLSVDQKKRLRGLHLKFDLGMTRLGFSLEEAQTIKELLKNSGLEVAGICGHFSQADRILDSNSKDLEGLNALEEISKVFELPIDSVHAPNSAALGLGEFNVGSRPGLSLYGLSDEHKVGEFLEPALSLYAPIVNIRPVKKGVKVSYGGTWESPTDTNIGVLLIGYADGLPRGLSGSMNVSNNGKTYPQVGTVCMDYTMVDLGAKNDLKIGDKMAFFDQNHNPRALSDWANTLGCITYELLVGLGDRLNRRIV